MFENGELKREYTLEEIRERAELPLVSERKVVVIGNLMDFILECVHVVCMTIMCTLKLQKKVVCFTCVRRQVVIQKQIMNSLIIMGWGDELEADVGHGIPGHRGKL